LVDADLEKLIKELKDYGLMGIEVYYSQHTNQQVAQYHSFASKYDLLVTAGSDFHGRNKPHIQLGLNCPIEHLKPFFDKIC